MKYYAIGAAFSAIALLTTAMTSPVLASESVTPTFAGITIGIPAGAAPPPGVYSSTTFLYYKGVQDSGEGQKTNLGVRVFEGSQVFLVSTGTHLFGGQLFGYVVQPAKTIDVTTPMSESRPSGAFNTILSPVNLSWDLGRGFYGSLGETFFIPDGTYSLYGPRAATGFFTFEQEAALTYLKNGYDLTVSAHFDINATNPTTRYLSGNDVGIDFTATKAFGKLSVGLGAYLVEQFNDDKLNGMVVQASPYNGVGNKWREFALGPYVSYDFNNVSVSAWFTQDVYARNTVKAGVGWLRVSVPLGNPFGLNKPVPRSALADRT